MNKFVYLSVLLISITLISCGDGDSNEKVSNENDQKVVKKKRIVFFGNSLTAGYKLEMEESFPSLIQNKIDSAGLNYEVVNAGNSGETTSGGLERVDWILKQGVDIFALELGANDALRGQSLDATKKNLAAIIEKVKADYPEAQILLIGMEAPPNYGEDYTNEFRALFVALADQYKTEFLPFLLKGVATDSDLLLDDELHPNATGQRVVANNVWEVLEGMLNKVSN